MSFVSLSFYITTVCVWWNMQVPTEDSYKGLL